MFDDLRASPEVLWGALIAFGIVVQPLPSALQRCHWYVKAMSGVPVHVPGSAVSVPPSRAAPSIVGVDVLSGRRGATAVVGADRAVAVPPSLRAVTETRSSWPTSAGVAVYDLAVAPSIGTQFAPSASQRCHR